MKSMFDDKKEVVNEGIPFLSLGGVFNQDISSLSKYVAVGDKMAFQKAIIDFFTYYPEVTPDMIDKLANTLKMEVPTLNNEIHAIMTSLFNRGLFVKNPNTPIAPDQLRMGIQVEMEHTDNPLIAERIARDHLTEMPSYYTRLAEMEAKFKG